METEFRLIEPKGYANRRRGDVTQLRGAVLFPVDLPLVMPCGSMWRRARNGDGRSVGKAFSSEANDRPSEAGVGQLQPTASRWPPLTV